jgi:hypothetical protein
MRSNWTSGLTIVCLGIASIACSFAAIHYRQRAEDSEWGVKATGEQCTSLAKNLDFVTKHRDVWVEKYETVRQSSEYWRTRYYEELAKNAQLLHMPREDNARE